MAQKLKINSQRLKREHSILLQTLIIHEGADLIYTNPRRQISYG
jgi:hypothetical protein